MNPRLLRSALIVVRPTAADVLDDEGRVVLTGHPSTPASWKDSAQDRWSRTVTPGGVALNALLLARQGANGIWLVVQREPAGNKALLELAAHQSNIYAASLKQTWIDRDVGVLAGDILRRLPEWKVSGFIADEETGEPIAITQERRILKGLDGTIPSDALTGAGPWHLDADGAEVLHGDPSEALHVTHWHRPALMLTVSGYGDHVPEDGTPEGAL